VIATQAKKNQWFRLATIMIPRKGDSALKKIALIPFTPL
jgi:hypothetical protein